MRKVDAVTMEPGNVEPDRDDTVNFADFVDIDPQTWSNLDKLGRVLRAPRGDLQETLEAALRSACQVITSADAAGINLVVRGKFAPQAVVGAAPHELDLVQQTTGIGPCIDAARDQTIIEVPDLRVDARWPKFSERAVELGVRSMLCVPLWVDELRLGSLSLYSNAAAAFDEQAQHLAGLFATHAALALADALRVAQLRQALINRDVIGQAKGILMTRHQITADQAFNRLSLASQALNVKLVELAEVVSSTGEIPAH